MEVKLAQHFLLSSMVDLMNDLVGFRTRIAVTSHGCSNTVFQFVLGDTHFEQCA